MAFGVELRAQRAHAAVHHVARRNDVGARARMRDRRFRQQLEAQVVVHRAVLQHDAAVAVGGVAAQAHVGDHDELRVGLLQGAHRELHDALVVVRP